MAEDTLEKSGPARGTLYVCSREDRMIDRIDIKQYAEEEARRKVGGSNKYQSKGVGIARTCRWTEKGTLRLLTAFGR